MISRRLFGPRGKARLKPGRPGKDALNDMDALRPKWGIGVQCRRFTRTQRPLETKNIFQPPKPDRRTSTAGPGWGETT